MRYIRVAIMRKLCRIKVTDCFEMSIPETLYILELSGK